MNVINIRSIRTLVVGMKSGFESNSYQDLPNHLDYPDLWIWFFDMT